MREMREKVDRDTEEEGEGGLTKKKSSLFIRGLGSLRNWCLPKASDVLV